MPGCCAYGCSNRAEFGKALFSIPQQKADRERYMKWLHGINRMNFKPTRSTRLCEDHFTKDQFEKVRVDGKKKLKWNAVPTVFTYRTEQFCGPSTSFAVPARTIDIAVPDDGGIPQSGQPSRFANHPDFVPSVLNDCVAGVQVFKRKKQPISLKECGRSTTAQASTALQPNEGSSGQPEATKHVSGDHHLSPLDERLYNVLVILVESGPSSQPETAEHVSEGSHLSPLAEHPYKVLDMKRETGPSSQPELAKHVSRDHCSSPLSKCSNEGHTIEANADDGAVPLGETSCPLKAAKSTVFKCCFCYYSTTDQREILSHVASHSVLRLFKCQYCYQSFDSEFVRDSHVQMHTDIHLFRSPIPCAQLRLRPV